MTDISSLPKAVLHDHLDGGLRVETVLELADDIGYRLPANGVEDLGAWFNQGGSGSLERYLEAFDHTVAVMQTADNVARVAYESAMDHSTDGVVYAESRFDPTLSTQGDLTREDVIEAALDGFRRASDASGIVIGAIVIALRHLPGSEDTARAAVRFKDEGVVAFDLAGPEAGFPPDDHLAAIKVARDAGLGITLHAGEGDGVHSMWRALALCGAQRIGHGVRIAEDTDFDGSSITALGPMARRVRDHRIPLEISVTSNVHTSAVDGLDMHPLRALYDTGFNVTINTDNKLMSGVTVGSEYELAANHFGLVTEDLGKITVRAVEAGFGDWDVRRRLIAEVIEPAYGI